MSAISLPKLPAIASSPVAVEVLNGLTERPKTLSPWLFYDQAGSRLFEEITELPEYYVTRTERQILAEHADEIISAAARGRDLSLIELGAGTATKTGLLLDAAVRLQGSVTYYPIDVSETALEEARTRLEAELPDVTVEPIVGDYTDGMRQNKAGGAAAAGRRLVLYIGSSIGNFSPADALEVLRGVRSQLGPGDCLLLGTDMVKDTHMLLAAYDDAAGVTAKFNKNLLVRINRELDANFNPQLFRHQARWNEQHSRIEMHLESLLAQRVTVRALDLEVRFSVGETIHSENSYKFTDQRVLGLLTRAGFRLRQQWSDANHWFTVYLAATN
jgi:L-histidine Nalpha-methyltransferase